MAERRPATMAAAGLIAPILALTPVLGSAGASAVPLDVTESECPPADPGQASPGTPWPQEQTDIRTAWAFSGRYLGEGVKIAVVDSGYNAGHPKLQNITSAEYEGESFVTVDEVPIDVDFYEDCAGHGTEVTSVIAAQFTDDTEFVGVAPNATVIPIRVKFDLDSKVTNGDIADGIDYAVDAGADIINVSLETSQDNPDLREAVRRAEIAEVLIVAAAGNFGDREAYPAKYSETFSNVISVGAVDQNGVIMGGDAQPTSGTASNVSVVAPGVQVPLATGTAGYTVADGTSYAAPFVSGVAALMLNAYPDLKPAQIRRRLEITAEHTGYGIPDRRYGWGMVNPVAAVTAVLPEDLENLNANIEGVPPEPIAPVSNDDDDTTTRDRALAAAGGACGVSLAAIAVAFTYRKGRARGWKPGLPDSVSR